MLQRAGSSRPYSSRSRRIEGVEYQTLMRWAAIASARGCGLFPSSSETRTTAAPHVSGTNRSRIERSKWKGAWDEKRSSGRGAKAPWHQSTKASALAWVWTTPLGLPVEPDV